MEFLPIYIWSSLIQNYLKYKLQTKIRKNCKSHQNMAYVLCKLMVQRSRKIKLSQNVKKNSLIDGKN